MMIILFYYREGRYHHLYVKEFIDRNAEACGVSYSIRFKTIYIFTDLALGSIKLWK